MAIKETVNAPLGIEQYIGFFFFNNVTQEMYSGSGWEKKIMKMYNCHQNIIPMFYAKI